MQVPILGTLFKSRDYVNHQTELAIIVTPTSSGQRREQPVSSR